jgi:hypothetical protein
MIGDENQFLNKKYRLSTPKFYPFQFLEKIEKCEDIRIIIQKIKDGSMELGREQNNNRNNNNDINKESVIEGKKKQQNTCVNPKGDDDKNVIVNGYIPSLTRVMLLGLSPDSTCETVRHALKGFFCFFFFFFYYFYLFISKK